ncbi:MAG: lipid-binding SYLF domain-containing protein [Bryobacteraceae bacterium]|nr:lipid-binding SYLF domain-containing protein [Bryobacterales bacterium]NUN01478.1 lipid-binding SYLF domain-containing protein [Bryobacteraceae bacterium]
MRMRLPLLLVCMNAVLFSASKSDLNRLNESAAVLEEVMAAPDKAIPQDLLDRSHCIVVVPGLKKAAFIIGGKYGRGFLTCRKASRVGWSAPGAVRVEGGSFGFQLGGSETDVVMLVMNERGADRLLSSKFTVGGDASAAAGPVGRTASAQTDATLRAEILTWSRSRGLFAGVSLQGATLRQDISVNESIYGKAYTNRDIVNSGLAVPAGASRLISLLNKYSSRK